MGNKAKWEDVVRIVRGISNRQNGPPVSGKFIISDKEALHAVIASQASADDTHLHLVNNENPQNLQIGQEIDLEIYPRVGFGLLVPNTEALLKAQDACIKEPPAFLLLDESISSSDEVADNHSLTQYRIVLRFVQMLKSAAAFLDADQCSLIFIKDGKFEVPVEYTDIDLRQLPSAVIEELNSVLPKGVHSEQCKCIMADAVVDMTKHLPTYKRFSYLLEHAVELKKRYEQGYSLFASGFSYEKVRDQVESARIEYIGKIHKVVSDIQNQLLGIPVATIVVATQMKDAKFAGYEFWVNTSVFIGCWIFAVLVLFLLKNQSHTIDVIAGEIERQKHQIEKEYAPVASSFSDTFLLLASRAKGQKKILLVIDCIVVVGLLLSHVVYYKLTAPVNEWLRHLFAACG